MSRQHNTWTTHEIALVAQHYATRMPAAELAALIPRHPWIPDARRPVGKRSESPRRADPFEQLVAQVSA